MSTKVPQDLEAGIDVSNVVENCKLDNVMDPVKEI